MSGFERFAMGCIKWLSLPCLLMALMLCPFQCARDFAMGLIIVSLLVALPGLAVALKIIYSEPL